MQSLVTSWHSAKVVRTREKVSFFFGVMSLLVSALLFGMSPEYGSSSLTTKNANESRVSGGFMLHIPFRGYIYSRSALIPTRSAPGITFSSTSVIMLQFSTSFTSGSFLPIRRCSWHATVSRMGPLRVRSSHGETALCSTTPIK